MTVTELIDELSKIEDKNLEVTSDGFKITKVMKSYKEGHCELCDESVYVDLHTDS